MKRMKLLQFALGRFCVAKYDVDGEFYRAKVVEVNSERRVSRLQFVDFGKS